LKRILIDGFQYPPTTELTHSPPYYAEFLERYGFRKTRDYFAYTFNRQDTNVSLLRKLAQRVSRNKSIETRPLVAKELRAEVRLIVEIYNAAWAQNWGFLPISPEEGDTIADSLGMIIDPQMVQFAFVKGEPVAVIGFIPDPNYALRPRWRWYGDSDFVRIARLMFMRRRIPRVRGMFLGIKPQYRRLGIPALLVSQVVDYLLSKHYVECDASLLLEDNDGIIKLLDAFGGHYYKRWRIYDLPLK